MPTEEPVSDGNGRIAELEVSYGDESRVHTGIVRFLLESRSWNHDVDGWGDTWDSAAM